MSVVRFSQLFLPTLKEAPADATAISHRLLIRAGFIRQLGAGIYSNLPLALRSIDRIEAIIREEMNAIGGQEFRLPALHPADLWQESGRWSEIDETMFRLQDRRHSDLVLGMTHEEIFTDLARRELRSYRELPQIWYQIQTKFRDELRPKGGLLRVREFTMKDSYSFDVDQAGLDRAYEKHRQAYERIFRRCGIEAAIVQAFSGVMGGRESSEFMAATDAGEDTIVFCRTCQYAANLEVARSRVEAVVDAASDSPAPGTFPTPGVVTIDALAGAPYNVPAHRQMKTLIYMADEKPVVVVVRGDDDLNEAKLQSATGAVVLRPARPEEIPALMGAQAGSLGAVGFDRAPVFVDEALQDRRNMVTGANQDGFHLRGVDVRRDVIAGGAQVADLRTVRPGQSCPRCGGTLEVFTALEVGHIFKLGTRYSTKLGAYVSTADGEQAALVMGHGIGVGRIMAAAIEQHSDADGIIWPVAIAPFRATVLTLAQDPEVTAAAEEAAQALADAGADVLLDDRDERPGVKFKDADLVGIPIRVAVGKRGLADNRSVEWKLRRAPGPAEFVPLSQLAARASAFLAEELSTPPRD